MDNKFQKILILRLSAVGDVVNVLPALRALRAAYPSARIAWLVEDRAKDILTDNPDLDEIFVFPRKKWQKGIKNPIRLPSTLFEAFRFFRNLRRGRFDLALDFQGNLKSGLMVMFSGGRVKLGFDAGASKEWNHLFTNMHAGLAKTRIHRVDKFLSLIRKLGISSGYEKPHLVVTQDDQEFISDFLKKRINPAKRLVAIHPGTSDFGKYKRWPEKNYAELADTLIERLGVEVVFTWGPSELEMVEEIVSLMRQTAFIAPETRSIKQLAELIRQSGLFISCDTGPMHIASIMGIPQVAIFGPKDPVIYGPYAGRRAGRSIASVVRKDMPCSPCKKRKCDHNSCIKAVQPEDVFQAASNLLL